MFTGIVEETGEIVARERDDDGLRLRIAAEEVTEGLSHGQSVSVSGACLTVERYGRDEREAEAEAEAGAMAETEENEAEAERTDGWFEVFLAAETVSRTYLGDLAVGDAVNLERAMPADGRFDGHVVQGHVDAVATVESVTPVGDDWAFAFRLPEGYDRYVVEKGSITLDGISLTVAERDGDRVTAAIIPTTYDLTTLSAKEPGDPVHLEVDVLAKYVERLLEAEAVTVGR